MSKIVIVTDSIACLPDDIARKYNIIIVPCYLIWDNVQFRDGIDMTAKQAYERLRTAKTLPTTTSTIQGEFVKVFESLKGKVDGVVVVTVTSKLGACYNSVALARDIVKEIPPLKIVDSRSAHLAEGFAAIAAAKAAQRDGTLEEVARAAREVALKSHAFFYVDPEYVTRSARGNLPPEAIEKWKKMRVMMMIKDGNIEPHPIEGDAQDLLIKLIDDRVVQGARVHIGIAHGDVDPTALRNRIEARYHPFELLTTFLTPVSAVHTGPGTVGVSIYNE